MSPTALNIGAGILVLALLGILGVGNCQGGNQSGVLPAGTSPAPKNRFRLAHLAVSIASILICLLAFGSVLNAWQASLGRVTTTGCEEEALFSLWKGVTGEAIYSDPLAMPYAVSYFNWLFYWVYVHFAQLMLWGLGLDISALPYLARLLSLTFSAVSVGLLYALLRRLDSRPRASVTVAERFGYFAVCVLLLVNPLTGSWIFTTRPDMAAMACELCGLWLALQYAQTGSMRPLWMAVAAGLAAWSFKHNFVNLLGGLFLFLVWRRQWRVACLVVITCIMVAGGTLMMGGAQYRHSLIGAQMNCQVSLASGVIIVRRALSLAPQLLGIALVLGAAALCRRRWLANLKLDLISLVAMVTLALALLGVTKQGADTNYFIPATVYGTLWGIGVLLANRSEGNGGRRLPGLMPWIVVLLLGWSVAGGLFSQGSKLASQVARGFAPEAAAQPNQAVAREIARLKQHLRELPGPVFVNERACNLPWVQPQSPNFVYSFTYVMDRKAELPFEKGGIGGLIEAGYFETIVVLEQGCACESARFARRACTHVTMNQLPIVLDGPTPLIDGGAMRHYQLAFRDGWFSYYRKRDALSHAGQ